MITALILMALMIVVGFAAMSFRRPDHLVVSGPLSPAERVYVIIAVAPVLLTLAAPSIVAFALGTEAAARQWTNRVSNCGIGLSLFLTMAGIYFLWRKRRQAQGPSPWLCAAILVAAVPVGLLAILVVARAPWWR